MVTVDALWLCGAQPGHRRPLKCATLFSRTRLVSCRIHHRTDPTPSRDRRWYNPDRRRSSSSSSSFCQPEIIRRWAESDAPISSLSGDRFVVVSYNILGENNASKHRDLYSHIPSHFMKWDRRKQLIFQELIELNPDIVCLQEVDRYIDLLSYMKKEGYVGGFKRRTGLALDGCAMFWKENLFRLLEGETIEFKEYGLRDNVAQLFVFEMCKVDSIRLLVGNIHVLFNPNRGDIKLGQIHLLLRKAHALSKKWGSIPVVLAGDFNSTPHSAIYEFLSSSELNISVHDRRHLFGQNSYLSAQLFGMSKQMKIPFNDSWTDEEVKIASGDTQGTKVEHPLKLYSTYASVKGNARTRGSHGEPLATTYHLKFLGTVDYLWYSDGLAPTRVLDTIPVDILRKTGLPGMKLGSDHLALVSEFAFTRRKQEEDYDGTRQN